jgi:predicted PurR-regulated permease PerM
MDTGTSSSPKWSPAAKAVVALTGMVLVGALLNRFNAIIPLLVLAWIVAFLVVPVVRTLNQRARMSWALAANLCFLILILIIVAASTATSVAVAQQLQALFQTIQSFLSDIPDFFATVSQQTHMIGPFEIDLSQFDLALLAEQLLAAIQPFFGQASTFVASLATGAIESVAKVIFVVAVAYFIVVDFNRIQHGIANITIPGYTEDVRRLRSELGSIWNAFLRGQLLVVSSTGVLTWILVTVLGVRFSLGLGFLGGVAKFVPILGPTSAGLVAALVAFFQPSNWFGLTPLAHAALVALSIFVLDQAIDNLIVPRIIGTSLNLHPVVILVGLLIGANLAGVIGLLLSAPTIASLSLLSRYTYRKMVDLSPWDPPIDVIAMRQRPASRLLRLLQRLKHMFTKESS